MQSRPQQVVGNMKHHNFTDEQGICAKRLGAEKSALKTNAAGVEAFARRLVLTALGFDFFTAIKQCRR